MPLATATESEWMTSTELGGWHVLVYWDVGATHRRDIFYGGGRMILVQIGLSPATAAEATGISKAFINTLKPPKSVRQMSINGYAMSDRDGFWYCTKGAQENYFILLVVNIFDHFFLIFCRYLIFFDSNWKTYKTWIQKTVSMFFFKIFFVKELFF